MIKKISLFFGISLIIFLLNLTPSLSLNCTLRNGACIGDEECVFSMLKQTDSHASQCGTPGYNFNVCCEEPGATLVSTVKFLTPCDPNLNEAGVLSLFDASDSHVERYQETFYPYHICLNSSLGRIQCSYQSSCDPGEGLASLYDTIPPITDSHVARYSDYSTKICCGFIPPYYFKIWIDEPRLFTIGKPGLANIYVQNLGTESDSYTITSSKEIYDPSLNPAPQLVHVSMPSNRIHSLEPGKIGNTFATITVLGPITKGNVNFTVTSESNPSAYLTGSIDIMTGYPISLPEFELIGMIQLLILASLLVVSYSSHFR